MRTGEKLYHSIRERRQEYFSGLVWEGAVSPLNPETEALGPSAA